MWAGVVQAGMIMCSESHQQAAPKACAQGGQAQAVVNVIQIHELHVIINPLHAKEAHMVWVLAASPAASRAMREAAHIEELPRTLMYLTLSLPATTSLACKSMS